jgi:retinol-binding protein 3
MNWRIALLVVAWTFISSLTAIAQGGGNSTLDGSEQKRVIDSISHLLTNNYIFPEVAKKMNDHLQDNYKKGVYNSITSVGSFANQLTSDLQSISKDKHIKVNFNPGMVAQMRKAQSSGQPQSPNLDAMRMNNFGFKELKLLPGNIGYMDLRSFTHANYASETAVAAMNFLMNASALIIDLRFNGGGSPSMIQLLTSYLYGPEPVHLNTFYYRPSDKFSETWTFKEVQGKRRPDIPVYVLTSNKTFSAAEEFTYNLKNLKRATIIGETTGGGAHPGGVMPAADRFTIFVPTGRAINPITKTNWEGTGVAPDIQVKAADALVTAHVKALEDLVAKSSGPASQVYEWELFSVKATKEPVQLTEETLKSYVGEYGEKKIVFENGELYFFPFPNNKVKLKALTKEVFELTGIGNVRLKILFENNVVTGIAEVFNNGSVEKHGKKRGF